MDAPKSEPLRLQPKEPAGVNPKLKSVLAARQAAPAAAADKAANNLIFAQLSGVDRKKQVYTDLSRASDGDNLVHLDINSPITKEQLTRLLEEAELKKIADGTLSLHETIGVLRNQLQILEKGDIYTDLLRGEATSEAGGRLIETAKRCTIIKRALLNLSAQLIQTGNADNITAGIDAFVSSNLEHIQGSTPDWALSPLAQFVSTLDLSDPKSRKLLQDLRAAPIFQAAEGEIKSLSSAEATDTQTPRSIILLRIHESNNIDAESENKARAMLEKNKLKLRSIALGLNSFSYEINHPGERNDSLTKGAGRWISNPDIMKAVTESGGTVDFSNSVRTLSAFEQVLSDEDILDGVINRAASELKVDKDLARERVRTEIYGQAIGMLEVALFHKFDSTNVTQNDRILVVESALRVLGGDKATAFANFDDTAGLTDQQWEFVQELIEFTAVYDDAILRLYLMK